MQRTHSSNSIIKLFLLTIALVVTTFSSAHAQTSSEKPVQAPERVGVDTADALPLSLNEAIRLALHNNNDIRTSRIDVEKAEHNLTARRGRGWEFCFWRTGRGSFALLYVAGMLCILSGIGIGTIVATFTRSQQQAQLLSFFVNPPLSMLSGATRSDAERRRPRGAVSEFFGAVSVYSDSCWC